MSDSADLTVDQYPRHGDKENSHFFETYLDKIYDRRRSSGLEDLLMNMRAIVVQVQTGDAIDYMAELYLMTPYRFHAAYQTATHKAYILRITDTQPDYIVLEPLLDGYTDELTHFNLLYPNAKAKRNARYIGEIYQTRDLAETRKVLEDQQFRFMQPRQMKNTFLANSHIAATDYLYYTRNTVMYTDSDLLDYDAIEAGERIALDSQEKARLEMADHVQREFELFDILRGVDHLATRVLNGDREHAILEFVSLTNYYFWGAYNIEEMNSSTNITRNPNIDNELHSPAKVFTANNVPYYVNSIDDQPSPTEDFVRNYGRRMHHIAYDVVDGERGGLKNIDYIINKLVSADIPFLAEIVGECTDIPDLKQIFSRSSRFSFLITEYVQRCHDFEGFFTKGNVASLTEAAGKDEQLQDANVYD